MSNKIKSQVNRLKVFSSVKQLMNDLGRCPTAQEVSDISGLPYALCLSHLGALKNADGLPFPMVVNAPYTHSVNQGEAAVVSPKVQSVDRFISGTLTKGGEKLT